MSHRIYWVKTLPPGRLAVMARPRGNDWLAGDVATVRQSGVDVVVSMLEPHEAGRLGLAEEGRHCLAAGMEFVSLPIEDHNVPASIEAAHEVVAHVSNRLAAGKAVAAHCFAGLGRSPLMIGLLLIHRGHAVQEAFDLISEARGWEVPEMAEQLAWAEGYAAWLARR